MTELSIKWDEYKAIRKNGKRTPRALTLEDEIHEIQKQRGDAPYNFDEVWAKIAREANPSVSGPSLEPIPEKIAPQANFTEEQADDILIKEFGKDIISEMEYCARLSEAMLVKYACIHDKLNPDNKNVARRGQATNFSSRIQEQRAEKKKNG